MKRKIITVVAGVLLVILAINLSNFLKENKKELVKKKGIRTATVFTKVIENDTLPIVVNATGTLLAKNRIELFAEVQGVMKNEAGSFKSGMSYKRGQNLVNIDSEVYKAGLMSQKSNLQNLVTGALADIRLDYPKAFDKWSQFLAKMDVNKPLPALPQTSSEKEKMFITGRNIYSTYYSVRNMELTLQKYMISAPFDGVLVEALVTPGSLIRPGQKLGTFIQPTVYELETPVSSSMVEHLAVGQKVEVSSTIHSNEKWEGEITRINSLINSETQTVNVYVQVSGKGLSEGMYLKTNFMASEINHAVELPRSVIFDENQVFVVRDSTLVQKTIEPLYYNENTVVVGGLENGEVTLTKLPAGAYAGMKVKIYQPTK